MPPPGDPIPRGRSALVDSNDTAESDVAGRGVDRFGMARRRTIAPATGRCTKTRAAFQYPARNAHCRLARIVARFHGGASRVLGDTAGLGRIGRVLRRVPVGRPLPGVADHVEHAFAIGWKGTHRRGSGVAVAAQILVRETTLPGIGHVLATGRHLIAPGELRTVEAADMTALAVGPAPVGSESELKHWLQSRRSTLRDGGLKTRPPAFGL